MREVRQGLLRCVSNYCSIPLTGNLMVRLWLVYVRTRLETHMYETSTNRLLFTILCRLDTAGVNFITRWLLTVFGGCPARTNGE